MAKYKIRYKSGAEVTVTADALRVVWDTNLGRAVEMAWSNMKPQPLAIGLMNIESVWELS